MPLFDSAILDTKSLISGLFGAGVAMIFAWVVRIRQRTRDNAVAGNLAIATMGIMFNQFSRYRMRVETALNESLELEPHAPLWLQMRPVVHHFNETVRVDLKSLGFLFGKKTVHVMNNLIDAEQRYHGLINLHKMHYEAMTELQQAVATLQKDSPDKAKTIGDLEKNLLVHLPKRVAGLNAALIESFEHDGQVIHGAVEALYDALKSIYGPKIRGFAIPPEMTTRSARTQQAGAVSGAQAGQAL